MQRDFNQKALGRIIDANFNRLQEGVRVCEEIARFILVSRPLTLRFKAIRHRLSRALGTLPQRTLLIQARNSSQDIGKNIFAGELKRKNYQDIFFANIQRCKESARVLEEFSKLLSSKTAVRFKNIRYELYCIEKKMAGEISSLRHH